VTDNVRCLEIFPPHGLSNQSLLIFGSSVCLPPSADTVVVTVLLIFVIALEFFFRNELILRFNEGFYSLNIFRPIRRIAKSDCYFRHVRLSAWNISFRTGRDLWDLIFEDFPVFEEIQVALKTDKSNDFCIRRRNYMYDSSPNFS